jgi:hypothetical protein
MGTAIQIGATNAASQGEVDTGTEAAKYVSPATLAGSSQSAMVLLSTATASNDATIDFENLLDSNYGKYIIVVENLIPASDSTLQLRLGVGGTYGSTNYRGGSVVGSNVDVPGGNTSATSAYDVSVSTSAGWYVDTLSTKGLSAAIEVFNPSSTSTHKQLLSRASYQNAGNNQAYKFGSGDYADTAAQTSVRLFMSSGNISSGTFTLYGVK